VFPVRYELDLLYYLGEIRTMHLEDTEARNDCAGEGQQRFNRPTDRIAWEPSKPENARLSIKMSFFVPPSLPCLSSSSAYSCRQMSNTR
jgi:hypothetical protein